MIELRRNAARIFAALAAQHFSSRAVAAMTIRRRNLLSDKSRMYSAPALVIPEIPAT